MIGITVSSDRMIRFPTLKHFENISHDYGQVQKAVSVTRNDTD